MGDKPLVIDSSAVVRALLVPNGLEPLSKFALHAPTLLWSEVGSALSQLRWRSEVSQTAVDTALRRLADARITPHPSAGLLADAVALAGQLGWAKTYDAEYAVLAGSLTAPLLTMDRRLARSLTSRVSILDVAIVFGGG